jgi:hypothetical protein
MTDAISSGATGEKAKDWIEPLARIGYTAKGVVYTLVGVLAVQVALGLGGSVEGSDGVMRTIAAQPFGKVLLILTALGLVGYVVWRFVQALLDPDNKGTDATGVIKRIGYAVSGVSYTLLAFTAVQLVMSGSSGGGDAKQTWTARLLSQPFGQWLVALVGVVIIGVGLYHFHRAYKASFAQKYDGKMSAQQYRWAKRIGRFGLSARGVTFLIIGGFFFQAARQSDASEAQGLDAALTTLAQETYGQTLLGIVALGFIAYGLHCFSRARYRRFEMQ